MCVQCALVAVAAVGAAGAFRNQIRVRIDQAVGIQADGEEVAANLSTPPPLLILLILAALADLHHDPVVAGPEANGVGREPAAATVDP